MKKLVLCLAAAIAFCACDSGETVITGNISDPVDIVYLVNIKGDTIDASQVTGGAFSLTCPFNPYTGVSILRGEGYDPINLIPDSWKITVSVKDDNISTEGSPLSYELQNLQQWALITFMDSYGDSTALKAIAEIVADAAIAKGEEGYEEALERLADAATLYAATRPLVATGEDFVGNGWDEVCEQECGLYDPDAEDEDECCEDDEE